MGTSSVNFIAGTPFSQRRLGLLRVVLVLSVVFVIAAPGWAQPANSDHHKIAPDFANFPVNHDGTVDVIIQFNQPLQTKHLQMMAAHGGKFKNSFQHINGAAYRIPVQVLSFLESHPDVAYVTPDRPNTSASDFYVSAVMADVAQSQYGFDGTGIGVAIIDSGVYQHDDLQNASNTGSRIVYSQSFVSGDSSVNDAYGHGTHVAGIVGGNGYDSQIGYAQTYAGIAPNVNIINLRVLDANGAGTDSQVIAAIERAIQLKNTHNIRVINLSLGRPVFESYTLDPLCQAAEAAWQAGIVVVVAAGNSGRDNTYGTHGYATINAPGNDPNVITVGATDPEGTNTRFDDIVASYSSKGPTLLDHIVKPDLVAPGNHVISLLAPNSTIAINYPGFAVAPSAQTGSVSGGSSSGTLVQGPSSSGPTASCTSCNLPSGPAYLMLSGTSMATPVVSGTAALMIQKDPTLTPDTVKARMMKTAWKGYPAHSWAYDTLGNSYFSQYDIFTIGAGYLDVDAALGNTDVTGRAGAASPTAVFNGNQHVVLVNGQSIVWGGSIVWGSSIVWADSIVWSNAITSNSLVWGAAGSAWGDTSIAANSIVWSNSIVWNGSSINTLGTGDGGDR